MQVEILSGVEGSREKAVILTALAYETISKGKHHLYTEVEEMMETKLARISQLSKQNPNMVFTSVGHLINEEMLIECHRDMDGDKAVGIDGVTKEMSGGSEKDTGSGVRTPLL